MELALSAPETCAICGDPIDADRAFARFYESGRRRLCCSPSCAGQYVRRPVEDSEAAQADTSTALIERLRRPNGSATH